MRSSIRRAVGRIAPAALALALPLTALAAPEAQAATAPVCTSTVQPALATKLSKDILGALSGRTDTVSVGVYDLRTHTWCGVHHTRHYDSASTVKAIVLLTLERRAQELHRGLTSWESTRATAMITRSDNDATTALWNSLGRTRIQRFLQLAGMTHTTLDAAGHWGLTQVTVQDDLRLLGLLDTANTVLTPAWRGYALTLMGKVVSSQRWGTPAGAPSGVGVHLKNGWLPRATHGWRVHSLGEFTRSTGDYRIVVLTQDNATMAYGVSTIERVARVVHRDLNPGTKAAVLDTAPSALVQRSDGSAVR